MSRFTRCDFLKLASAGAAAAAGGGLLWRWLANQNGAEVPTTASGGIPGWDRPQGAYTSPGESGCGNCPEGRGGRSPDFVG